MNPFELAKTALSSVAVLETACTAGPEAIYAMIGEVVEEVASDALTTVCPAYGVARTACGLLPACIEALVDLRTAAVRALFETFCFDSLLEDAIDLYCTLPSEIRGAIRSGTMLITDISGYVADPSQLLDVSNWVASACVLLDAGSNLAGAGTNLLSRVTSVITDIATSFLSAMGLPTEITAGMQDIVDTLVIKPLSASVELISDAGSAVLKGASAVVEGAEDVVEAAVCWTGLC